MAMNATKVILYSGGMDSFIGLFLLQKQEELTAAVRNPVQTPWQPVYFDIKSRYSHKEFTNMMIPERLDVLSGVLNLSSIEQSDAFVPQRNVLLCAATQAIYSASKIALCSVADDAYTDNDDMMHRRMSALLSHTAGYNVEVFSPLTGLRKAEAVRLYLDMGGDPEMLRQVISCYHPVELSCGQCRACERKESALVANGLWNKVGRRG